MSGTQVLRDIDFIKLSYGQLHAYIKCVLEKFFTLISERIYLKLLAAQLPRVPTVFVPKSKIIQVDIVSVEYVQCMDFLISPFIY